MLHDKSLELIKTKKLLSLFLPLLIILSLVGCFPNREVSLIKPGFKKIIYYDSYTNEPDPPRYQILIDGYWYPADENGNITSAGERQKQNREMQTSDDGGVMVGS